MLQVYSTFAKIFRKHGRQRTSRCPRPPAFDDANRKNHFQQHIPAEVVHEMVSSLSSAELVSVGLVNRTFQAEADRLLYRSIGHSMPLKKLISCLDTIAAVKSKAVLVKSLTILVDQYQTITATSAIIERLCPSLRNMTSLTQLRLRIFADISPEHRLALILALQRSTFSLTCFYASVNLELEAFIQKQTSLKCLLFDHESWNQPSALHRYRTLIERSPPENELSLFFIDVMKGTVTSFPAFSRDWSAAPIKQAILIQPQDISSFTLYIHELSDDRPLRRYVRSISDNFPGCISHLSLFIKDPRINMNPEGLASALSCLPELMTLNIHYWERKDVVPLSGDDRVDLARRWSAQCPKLSLICFPDRSESFSNGDRSWSIFGQPSHHYSVDGWLHSMISGNW